MLGFWRRGQKRRLAMLHASLALWFRPFRIPFIPFNPWRPHLNCYYCPMASLASASNAFHRSIDCFTLLSRLLPQVCSYCLSETELALIVSILSMRLSILPIICFSPMFVVDLINKGPAGGLPLQAPMHDHYFASRLSSFFSSFKTVFTSVLRRLAMP